MQRLTKNDLESMVSEKCQFPDCTHEDHAVRFLHARCHMSGGLEASYRAGTGAVLLACRVCKKPIAEIAVAEFES